MLSPVKSRSTALPLLGPLATLITQHYGFLVALFYMTTSLLLICFNKAAFAYYNFQSPNVLTALQTLCSIVLLAVCKHFNWIHYHNFSLSALKRLTPLCLAFLVYMVLGMISLRSVSIPIYTTLRRTGIVLVLLLERLALNKRASTRVHLSVCVMICGALLAGARDLQFDAKAYAIVFLYNASTALYLVLINRQAQLEAARPNAHRSASFPQSQQIQSTSQAPQQRLDKFDFMFYNNVWNLPFLCVLILSTGEWRDALQLAHDWKMHGIGLPLAIGGSSLLAFALNYSIFLNTSVNSALTQTVAGQAKDVVTVIAGFVMFASPLDLWNLLGIVLGFVGSLLYGLFKLYPNWPDTSSASASAATATASSHVQSQVAKVLLHSHATSNGALSKPMHPSLLHHHANGASSQTGSPSIRNFRSVAHPAEPLSLPSGSPLQLQHQHPTQHLYTSIPVKT